MAWDRAKISQTHMGRLWSSDVICPPCTLQIGMDAGRQIREDDRSRLNSRLHKIGIVFLNWGSSLSLAWLNWYPSCYSIIKFAGIFFFPYKKTEEQLSLENESVWETSHFPPLENKQAYT